MIAFGLLEWVSEHFIHFEGHDRNALLDVAFALRVFLTSHRARACVAAEGRHIPEPASGAGQPHGLDRSQPVLSQSRDAVHDPGSGAAEPPRSVPAAVPNLADKLPKIRSPRYQQRFCAAPFVQSVAPEIASRASVKFRTSGARWCS